MQSTLFENPIKGGSEEDSFYDSIIKDTKQSLLLFLSERGHGKSSSLKSIVKECKERNADITLKVFDPSQTWFKKSPLKYRQYITREAIKQGRIKNIGDCVYEIGLLSEEERRVFLGMVIMQDYRRNYEMSMNEPDKFKKECLWTIYVIEESNTIFNSYSLRKNDWVSPVLQDFISIGRNFKLGAFLLATAEEGEISPSLRRRSRRIYGRLVAEGDIARVRRTDKKMAEYLAKEIPRFNFVYWGERFFGPVHVKDTVTTTPMDYIGEPDEGAQGSGSALNSLIYFVIGAAIMLLFFAYFL